MEREDAVAGLSEQRDRFDRSSAEWNMLHLIIQWLKPVDKKKAPLPIPTLATPLRISAVFALGGIVGQVDAAEVGEKVNLPESDPAKMFANAFIRAGFVCELHRFKSPPRPGPTRPEVRPTAAPVRASVVHVVHLPG